MDSSPPGAPGEARSARSTVVLLVLAGLVVLALVAGGLAAALRAPAEFDPSTPEGVVQAYLQAMLSGDHQAAAEHLVPEVAERCEDGIREAHVPESLSARLASVETRGERVEVRVRFTQVSGPPPPLGGGEHTFEERFTLVSDGGRWRLDAPTWPYYHCPEPR